MFTNNLNPKQNLSQKTIQYVSKWINNCHLHSLLPGILSIKPALSNKGFPCSQHGPQLLWETQSFRRRLGLGLSARAGKTPPLPPFLPSWLSIFSIATSCYFSQLLILAEVRRSSFEFRGLYKIYMCFCCVELGEISAGTFLRLFSIESFPRLLFIIF